MYRRQMYPANQQVNLPMAVQYQPQYDPAFTQMMAQNLQQTQQRHDAVTAQMAEDMARRGEMFSFDPELQKEVLDAYKADLDKIAKDYGYNYAQAASKLVSRIRQEAANPYYNANRYHVEQAKMAQEAALKYGADALWINDPRRPGALREALQTGDLSSLETRVVQAPQYAKIAQDLGSTIKADMQALGLSQAQIRDVQERGMSALLQHGSKAGISRQKLMDVANKMVEAFKAAAPNMQFENREGYEWTQSDEGIANFLMSNWAGLEHSDVKLNYMSNPYFTNPTTGQDRTEPRLGFRTKPMGATVEAKISDIDKKWDGVSDNLEFIERVAGMGLEPGSVLSEIVATLTPRIRGIANTADVQGLLYVLSNTPIGSAQHKQGWEDLQNDIRTLHQTFYPEKYGSDGEISRMEGQDAARDRVIARDVFKLMKEDYSEKAEQKSKEARELFDSPVFQALEQAGYSRQEAIETMRQMEIAASREHFTMYEVPINSVVQNIAKDVTSHIGELVDSKGKNRTVEINRDGTRTSLRGVELQDMVGKAKSINSAHLIPASGELVLNLVDSKGDVRNVSIPADALYTGTKESLKDMNEFLTDMRDPKTLAGTVTIAGDTYIFERDFSEGIPKTIIYQQMAIPRPDGRSTQTIMLPVEIQDLMDNFLNYMVIGMGYESSFKKQQLDPYN